MRDHHDFEEDSQSQRGENVFTRICVGYIGSVDEENGVISVDLEDFIASRPVELSFSYFSGVGPGWFRFMPSKGDKVLLGFTPTNKAEVLAYKPISYAQMAQFARDANPPFIFRKLKSGEFEIVSSGYAEIWGSQLGKLHLSGGLASIDLDRATTTITHNAATHFMTSDTSELRFGAVRRNNPLTPNQDQATIAPGVTMREHFVKLVQGISGVYTKLYEATIGRVMDYTPGLPAGVFSPRLGSQVGLPLRADINIYTEDGVQKVRLQIDDAGNAQLDLPASAASGFKMISTIGTYLFQALNIQMQASGEADISGALKVKISSGVQVDIEAPLITANGSTGNVLTNTTAISDFTGNFIQAGVPNFRSL